MLIYLLCTYCIRHIHKAKSWSPYTNNTDCFIELRAVDVRYFYSSVSKLLWAQILSVTHYIARPLLQ